jgi:hypothetical protein
MLLLWLKLQTKRILTTPLQKKTKDAVALSVLLDGLRHDPHYTAFVREYANTTSDMSKFNEACDKLTQMEHYLTVDLTTMKEEASINDAKSKSSNYNKAKKVKFHCNICDRDEMATVMTDVKEESDCNTSINTITSEINVPKHGSTKEEEVVYSYHGWSY